MKRPIKNLKWGIGRLKKKISGRKCPEDVSFETSVSPIIEKKKNLFFQPRVGRLDISRGVLFSFIGHFI